MYERRRQDPGGASGARRDESTRTPGKRTRSMEPRGPFGGGTVYRSALPGAAPGAARPGAGDGDPLVRAAAEPGQPVPGAIRTRAERTLGADLSGVRLHSGAASHAATQAVGARAYTLGQDIHFASGELQPGSPNGDRLLAHELAHVTDRGADVRGALAVSEPGDPSETRADGLADRILAGASAGDVARPAPGVAYRWAAGEIAAHGREVIWQAIAVASPEELAGIRAALVAAHQTGGESASGAPTMMPVRLPPIHGFAAPADLRVHNDDLLPLVRDVDTRMADLRADGLMPAALLRAAGADIPGGAGGATTATGGGATATGDATAPVDAATADYALGAARAEAHLTTAGTRARADALQAARQPASAAIGQAATEVIRALDDWRSSVDAEALARLDTDFGTVAAHGALAALLTGVGGMVHHHPVFLAIHGAIEVAELAHEMHEIEENRELIARAAEVHELTLEGVDATVLAILNMQEAATMVVDRAHGAIETLSGLALAREEAHAGADERLLDRGVAPEDTHAAITTEGMTAITDTVQRALGVMQQGMERLWAAPERIRTEGRRRLLELQARFARGGDRGSLRMHGRLDREGDDLTLRLERMAGEDEHETSLARGATLEDLRQLGIPLLLVIELDVHAETASMFGEVFRPMVVRIAGGELDWHGADPAMIGEFARPGAVDPFPRDRERFDSDAAARGEAVRQQIERLLRTRSLTDLQSTALPVEAG